MMERACSGLYRVFADPQALSGASRFDPSGSPVQPGFVGPSGRLPSGLSRHASDTGRGARGVAPACRTSPGCHGAMADLCVPPTLPAPARVLGCPSQASPTRTPVCQGGWGEKGKGVGGLVVSFICQPTRASALLPTTLRPLPTTALASAKSYL